eukprot:CAMPEP_0183353502 /NCGR_PEP_ID=MMETSP0164_2-20130417/33288_1 /TAXON_ID=221442 /ORGANISM="Coccolithus pelagicus ssp braarudi, Strain PLY182g" /LENGTH=395 /DNA_ID=CAMNT_0025526177 /DNA_START=27 /DNA_END=1214 /DNA_ORIENTATION=-
MPLRELLIAGCVASCACLRPSSPLVRTPAQLVRRTSAPLAIAGSYELLDATSSVAAASALIADAAAVAEPLRQTDEAIRAASGDLGWWGTYIKTVEDGIFALHDALQEKGVPFPYGCAILAFVCGVKLVTLPLNWNQLSSSAAMKTVQPQQKLVSKWYGDNSNIQNQEVGSLFERLNVNPLSGCLPSLAQIPVFLGVYYSVTSIAKAKIFNEGFLWVPNLSGPIADRREGLTWLTEGWIDGHPKLGWEDTLLYLSIPAILVCTQTLSLNLLGSFEALGDKEESKSTVLVLKALPFMLGWFAMNAPAGLGLYWVFNNILTTTQTVVIKKILEQPELEPEGLDELLVSIGPRRDVRTDTAEMALDWAGPTPEQAAAMKAAKEAEAAAAEATAAEPAA